MLYFSIPNVFVKLVVWSRAQESQSPIFLKTVKPVGYFLPHFVQILSGNVKLKIFDLKDDNGLDNGALYILGVASVWARNFEISFFNFGIISSLFFNFASSALFS